MKSLKGLISVLSTINILGAIACIIIMFYSKSEGNTYWPTYIPIAISLVINALVFAFIGDLGDRVDKIEAALEKSGIEINPKKKETPKSYTPQTEFRVGEPIREKSSNRSGIVIEKQDNNIYIVEYDDDRGNTTQISGEELKSYFDR